MSVGVGDEQLSVTARERLPLAPAGIPRCVWNDQSQEQFVS